MTGVAAALALVCAGALPAWAQGGATILPSGLEVTLFEVILDAEMQIGRYRFLAPQIAARGFDMDALGDDFDHLCATVAAPALRAERPGWSEVVISLSSVAIPFGTPDPEVAQAFEGYAIDDGGCRWLQF